MFNWLKTFFIGTSNSKEAPTIAPNSEDDKRSIMQIDASLLKYSTNKRIDFFNKLPEQTKNHLESLINKENEAKEKGILLDSNFNDYGGYYGQQSFLANINNALDTPFIGYPALGYLCQNSLVSTIVDTIASDCTSQWIKFHSITLDNNDDKELSTLKKIEVIESVIKNLNIRSIIRECVRSTLIYGGCLLYPQLEGDTDELELPLSLIPSKVTKILNLNVINPIWCVALDVNYTYPLQPYYYEPRIYNIMGQNIHISRVCRFLTDPAPELLRNTYRFFSIPLIQLCLPYITDFEIIRKEIAKLVTRFNTNIIKTTLEASIKGQGLGWVANRVKMFNTTASNGGVLMLDKDTEEFQQLQVTFNTLDKLMSQYLEFNCITPKVTATRLFGQSPQGFNSSGEFEARQYAGDILEKQEKIVRPHLTHLIRLIQLQEFGEIDDTIDFTFNSILTKSDKEKSDIELVKAQTEASRVGAGILHPDEIRENIATDINSGYNNLDLTREPIDEDQGLDEPEL